MLDLTKRRSVDLLIDQFWKNGYLTISRKFGTYLPEPRKMGGFDVDIVARYKKDYAIGITLNREDLENPDLRDKIKFLASRQTKFTNKSVLLFVGIPSDCKKKFELLISVIDQDIRKNIKIQTYNLEPNPVAKREKAFLN